MDTELGASPLEGTHMLTHKQRRASHSITLVHTPSPPPPPPPPPPPFSDSPITVRGRSSLSVLNIYSHYTVSGQTQTSWSPACFAESFLKSYTYYCIPPGNVAHLQGTLYTPCLNPLIKQWGATVAGSTGSCHHTPNPLDNWHFVYATLAVGKYCWEVLLRHCLLHFQGHRPDRRQLSKPVRWNTIHSHGSSHVV